MAPIDYKSLMKDALLKLEELESKLAAARRGGSEPGTSEPIAILGVGCRFPGGADTPESFWKLLGEGRCASSEIPKSRWNVDRLFDANPDALGKMYSRHGCFLEDIDKFDAHFFGISPREAAQMDPQQRLLLEVTWEALERAGIAPTSLAGSQTAVMVGVMNNDYAQFAARSPAAIDVHTGGGTTVSAAAGRISYVLGLHGPSMVVDTACSSSLVSVHLACMSLRSKESDLAIAAGVNAILSPVNSIIESRTRILSPKGVCRTFDASADGIVRGEGCGVVVLKRLSDALAAGDLVLAVIRGSAVNHDGHTSALSVPNGLSQQSVIRSALADAGAAPGDISYIEAHGTATPLGDPIEVEALGAVFGRDRSSDEPLHLGSVKTNLGHLEGAAGIAGIIKVVLAIDHQEIPPHLHVSHPNPLIGWDSLPVKVAARSIPWPRAARPRLAGVSSFGFSGTNAHVVIEEPPEPPGSSGVHAPLSFDSVPAMASAPDEKCCLLALSAASEAGLKELVGRYVEFAAAHQDEDLVGLCFAANTSRAHFAAARCTVAAASMAELADKLARAELAIHPEETPVSITFCFSSESPEYSGMGRDLYAHDPAFREAFDHIDALLQPILGRSAKSIFDCCDGANVLPVEPEFAQLALFALEYALAALWQCWGVRPSAVVGNGAGECVAACVAGALSLQDALALATARCRLVRSIEFEEPAAIALQQFENIFSTLEFRSPRISLRAGATGAEAILAQSEAMSHAAYWTEQIRRPRTISDLLNAVGRGAKSIFLEIGPGSSPDSNNGSTSDLRIDSSRNGTVWLRSMDLGSIGCRRILTSLGEIYARGAAIAWERVGQRPRRRNFALPTYPFQRRRYWFNAGEQAITPATDQSATADLPSLDLLGVRRHSSLHGNGEIVYSTTLAAGCPTFFCDHRLFGVPVLPASAIVEMALSAASTLHPDQHLLIEDLKIVQALPVAGKQRIDIEHILVPGGRETHKYQLHSFDAGKDAWTLHASASVGIATDQVPVWHLEAAMKECDLELEVQAHFHRSRELGIDYGPAFRGITRLWRGPGSALCRAALPESVRSDAWIYRIHPALLDACLQVFLAASPDAPDDLAYLPIGIERMTVYQTGATELWSYCQLRQGVPGARTYRADFWITDTGGKVVAEVQGLTVKGTPRQTLSSAMRPRTLDDLGYRIEWRTSPLAVALDPGAPSYRYLVVAGQDETGLALSQRLRESGAECIVISSGDRYRKLSDDLFQLDPAERAGFDLLLSDLEREDAPRLCVVDLLPLDITSRAELKTGFGSVIHLAQAIAQRAWSTTPKLCVVTRGARRVASEEIRSPFQAPVWGLLQTLSMEHPEMESATIDLDSMPHRGEVAALLHELQGPAEKHVAYRRGERYVARLVRFNGAPSQAGAPRIRPNASYLITGGMGGLGLVVASWLVEEGARHIVLVGRSAPGQHAAEQIAEIESKGAAVSLIQADVANRQSLARLLESTLPGLAGVFHCAGVLDDGVLLNQTWESFERVMTPKIDGAWNLHELTCGVALDFFVCFSSIASMTGSPGQGNYAASNAFLDAFAEYRQALGLPGLSINWGSWMDGGMTRRSRQLPANRSPLPALRILSRAQALSALQELLRNDVAVAGAFAMDWPRFFTDFPQCAALGFFKDLSAVTSPPHGVFADELRREPHERWDRLLERHVTEQVARVLQLNVSEVQPFTRLFDLGLDSLTAMELKNNLSASLGYTLRSTLAFDYPTVTTLVAHLHSVVSGDGTEARIFPTGTPAMLEEVKHLTDDEIEQLVEQELNALAKGGAE